MTSSSHPADRVQPSKRRTWLRYVLVGLGLIPVASSAMLVRVSYGYYAESQRVRLDPLGLDVYRQERMHLPAPGGAPVLVLFGDSRIAMWTNAAFGEYDVVNRGVPLQTSEQALSRFDYDVAPLKPSIVIIQLGVNDLKNVSIFPERRDAIVAACEQDIAAIVQKSSGLGAKVVVTTIFSLGDVPVWRRMMWDPAPVAQAITEVNRFLITLTGDHVVVFDADPTLNDARGKVRPSFQADFLHENATAYAALGESLAPLVRRPSGGP